jgi:hypothetical protein
LSKPIGLIPFLWFIRRKRATGSCEAPLDRRGFS